jgi:hypothetical protein
MTQQDFLNGIEGTMNDFDNRLISKQEAMNYLLQHFINACKPVANIKESLGSLTYKVRRMRELQEKFFKGDKSMISEAKKYERFVDDQVISIMKCAGFSAEDLKKKFEPQKLF